jgi:hypothetical protein
MPSITRHRPQPRFSPHRASRASHRFHRTHRFINTEHIMTDIFSRSPWIALAAGAALTLASAAAFAGTMGNPSDRHAALMEMTTAQYFAGYAAEAKTLDAAHINLRDARACLVGTPSDTASTNPCGNEGNGAIPDATTPARQALAQEALGQLNDGLQSTDLTVAQNSARQAIETLRMAVR